MCLARKIGDVAHDVFGEVLLATGRDATIAEAVDHPIAGAVENEVGRLEVFVPRRVDQQQPEGPPPAFGAGDFFVFEQALTADRKDLVAEPQVGRDGGVARQRLENLVDQFAAGGETVFGKVVAQLFERPAHAPRHVHRPGRKKLDVAPFLDMPGNVRRCLVEGERIAAFGQSQSGFDTGGTGTEDGVTGFSAAHE